MKKILLSVIIVSIILFVGCDSAVQVHLGDYQVGFNIDSVSFGGDWSHLKAKNANALALKVGIENIDTSPLDIKLPLSYDDTNKPIAKTPSDNYMLDGNWADCSILDITSDFENTTDCVYTIPKSKISLTNKYYSKLGLKYNAGPQSVLDITIIKSEPYIMPNGFKYKANYEVVHDVTSDGPNLELVVMAEGYTAEEMGDYKKYVEFAFQDSDHFNFYNYDSTKDEYTRVQNDFFEYCWNQIRIIRIDTISADSGIDNTWYEDNKKTILNVNNEGLWKGGDFTRLRDIMSVTKPCGLNYNEVDAYIIFINREDFRSYSFTHFFEVGYKRGQPIHPVCIGAPVGYDINENDGINKDDKKYYEQIKTPAIAHELGHALARLQDEYIDPDLLSIYLPDYRNIDVNKDYKWKKFIDIGYGGGNINNNLVDGFEGGLYRAKGRYRPTYSTTMGNYNLINRQFGPVNTYHLTATFKARTSPVDLNVFDTDPRFILNKFEWSHYTIDDFHKEWEPSKF